MSADEDQTVTFTDDDGNGVEADEIAEDIDTMLEETNRLFVKGSDGNRYLVSVAVTFVRSV